MSGRTTHYGWKKVQAGDSLSEDGYEYTYADREDIDAKVWLGAEGHRHRGGTISTVSPSGPPTLTTSTTGGRIPAGTSVYYKISLVNTTNQESVASSEAFINTPAALSEPSSPSLTYASTGGALLGGDYYYVLSAYVGLSTSETRALSSSFISVNSTTGTNKVTLTLPSLPAGATGFNVYRRGPGESKYFFLASTTSTTTYVDNGSVAENCDRTLPTANTTNATNSVVVSYPGATPVVPTGYTWKIYRTYLNGSYNQSLLVHVVEFTAEATPTITPTYTDTGIATSSGSPITSAPTITNPSKIVLTDATEVQGVLPPANITYKETISFAEPGLLATKTGTFAWRCPYDNAKIDSVSISLGASASAAGSNIIVDVNKLTRGATPTSNTIFTTQAHRPAILAGGHVSIETVPDIVDLVKNDYLTVDIDQVSGGATPNDRDLLIQVVIWHQDTTAASVQFA